MTRIEEGYLAFEFGERWRVFKLDEHRDYRERIGKLDETKAVDFIGILDDKELYFIEVKDFRGYRIESKDRFLKGKLPDCQLIEGECQLLKGELPLSVELAQKVRDSIACIIGAYRTSSEPEVWAYYATLLCNKKRSIKVVLWLEHDLPSHLTLRRKAMESVSANFLKPKLKWLTHSVFVYNSKKFDLPDVKVKNLPRP
jgi:hypothetical protein